jgi:hypothetical protein
MSLILLWGCSFAPPAWGDEKNDADPNIYVRLPDFLVPVIQNREIKASYKLSLMIQLTESHYGESVSLLKPRIVDAIILDLYGVFSIIWEPYVHIPLKDLKKRLLRIAQKIAGKSAVKDILVQEFQSQLKA